MNSSVQCIRRVLQAQRWLWWGAVHGACMVAGWRACVAVVFIQASRAEQRDECFWRLFVGAAGLCIAIQLQVSLMLQPQATGATSWRVLGFR